MSNDCTNVVSGTTCIIIVYSLLDTQVIKHMYLWQGLAVYIIVHMHSNDCTCSFR